MNKIGFSYIPVTGLIPVRDTLIILIKNKRNI